MGNKFDKVIAVDGPAGSGKSVVAKTLAKKLGALYIDTGAMYRAVTLKALQENIDLEDEKRLSDLVKSIDITLEKDKEGNIRVFLNGKDVTSKLRISQVNKNISEIAKNKTVRKHLVELQRKLGGKGGVVEGRDISTVVFPKAYRKFYLDAHLEERIRRRYKQACEEGSQVNRTDVKEEVINRDRNDRTRKISPLRIDPEAIYIDTTNLTIDEVVQKLIDIIKNKI